jgi:diguanylate cyclase (GGDEF)-like protein/PAS domain S-box-containing protein
MPDSPLRILMVEDSSDDAELLLWHLKRSGIETDHERVETAGGMTDALERREWDIVIADYIMPTFSGIAALELLQKNGVDIPFIIVSGKMGEDTAVEAMKAGAHDYFLKGNLARLVPAIHRELEEAETRRQRKRAERELRTLKHAIETIPIGVTISDTEGRIIFTNEAEAEMHGYTVSELVGQDVRIFAPQEIHQPCDDEILKTFASSRRETVNIRKDGSTFPAYLVSSVVFDEAGNPVARVSACEDITERKAAEDRLRYMSTHDTLTGFYNRAYFEDEMERLRKEHPQPMSIIMVDVDGLKEVNDSLGHAAGDKVLKQTASVLLSVFRSDDIVARIGGDEFAVLMPGADHAAVEKAMIRIRSVITQASRPLGGLGLSLSIGAATVDDPDQLPEALRIADSRMYQDKMSKPCRDSMTRRIDMNDRRIPQ